MKMKTVSLHDVYRLIAGHSDMTPWFACAPTMVSGAPAMIFCSRGVPKEETREDH